MMRMLRSSIYRAARQFLILLSIWMIVVYGLNMLGYTRKPTPEALFVAHVNYGLFGFLNFLLFYTAIHWPIPQFLQHRSWRRALPALLLLGAGALLVKYAVAALFFPDQVLLMGTRNGAKVYRTFGMYLYNGMWGILLVLLCAFAYTFFRDWLQEDQRRAQLEQQKQEAEFAFLKMQLNTHFLINSLNSIYSLALVRSDQVTGATRTLTDILEYMAAQPPLTGYRSSLADEVRYLADFISLQRLRTGCDACIQMTVEGEPARYTIAPLLLVPFVENAFKHGVTNQPRQPVTIHLQCNEAILVFTVHNYKAGSRKDKTGGIGLQNVRKRLELVFPGHYTLDTSETETEYYCKLGIRW